MYGTTEPPEYDLGRVPVPVLLYWGNDDWFSTRENVEALAAQLPRLIATIEGRVRLRIFRNHQSQTFTFDVSGPI